MFTGIVEEAGRIVAFEPGARAWSLRVAARVVDAGTSVGDSIAVNGCCLTAVAVSPGLLAFDVLEESRRLTNFSALGAGGVVNLERSLRHDGRIGGHFVTGHIDGVGRVAAFEKRGDDHYLRVDAPKGGGRHLVHKGSIAIDGVSLTIAEVDGDSLAVWLIPHTLGATNLGGVRAGGPVNIEYDLLGKYVEKLLARA